MEGCIFFIKIKLKQIDLITSQFIKIGNFINFIKRENNLKKKMEANMDMFLLFPLYYILKQVQGCLST